MSVFGSSLGSEHLGKPIFEVLPIIENVDSIELRDTFVNIRNDVDERPFLCLISTNPAKVCPELGIHSGTTEHSSYVFRLERQEAFLWR